MSLAPTSNTALIATFTFELMSIAAKNYSSAGAATAARDAVSTAGQTLLPLSSSTELAAFRFDDEDRGARRSTPRRRAARAAATARPARPGRPARPAAAARPAPGSARSSFAGRRRVRARASRAE